ncbi:sulfite exporter TauE/SafE family protein [Motiliproteus sediminis]|uniref:sulfite exporter TauE/SafE family protein n=1 Tax=Motiliproteus sediminis TaxID=1468178 RepID=UPI001AEFB40F|nr:sulfite exporter TauE/SafE family protein [Motiliproteus sediminis]
MELAYSIAGLVVGFIVGLTGIGGGALMTPILIVGFGINPLVAVSTDLLYAAITKFGGVWPYAKKKLVAWKVVGAMLVGSVPGSLVTLWILSRIDHPETLEHLINLTLGVSLVLTSVAVFMRNRIREAVINYHAPELKALARRWRLPITSLAGLFLGGLVTLSSVGAGALGTALLILLFPHMTMPMIVATDLVHAVVLTSVAGVGHWQMGNVDTTLLVYLLIGSLPGVYVGGHLGTRLSPKVMQPIMGSLLLVIGLRFVIG